MTTSILVAAADAVTSEINSHPFGVDFLAERNWGDWEFLLEELNVLRVDVVPGGFALTEMETRGDSVYTPQVNVAIRKRFGRLDQHNDGTVKTESTDDLVLLLEQIHAFFIAEKIGTSDEFTWKECQIVMPVSPQMLRTDKQFLGILRLTLETSEAIP